MTNPIQLWHGQLSVEAMQLEYYWHMLDASEQTQSQQLKSKLNQSHYIQTHGLLRILLAESVNEKPQNLSIAKAQHGKPYLPDYPELAFNLSHSNNHLLIALAENCQLGVDIEMIKPRSNLNGLVKKCFSETEAMYWQNLPEHQKIPEFFRFWTTKEAFVKATGRGIALGLHQCETNPEQSGEFLNIPMGFGLASSWQTYLLDLSTDICAALVIDRHPNTLFFHDLTDMSIRLNKA